MTERAGGRRATIADIAAESGVSVAAVSYALNDKPGLSEATRLRILEVAARHDWAPSARARSLSRSRTDVVGLVVPAEVALLRDETFWMLFISGLEAQLREQGRSLLMHVEPRREAELEIYRSWHRRGMVDLVIVLDIEPADPRLPVLDELGLPYVLGGRPEQGTGVAFAATPDDEDMDLLVGTLAEAGCTSFARVAGDERMVFVQVRGRAFDAALAARGLEDRGTVHSTFGAESAADATLELASGPHGLPDVILFDSDLLAVTGTRALLGAGHDVPRDVQVVAFDDSALCRLVTPAISALSRDAHEFGRLVGDLVRDELSADRPRGGARSATAPGAGVEAGPLIRTAPRGRFIPRQTTRT